MRVTPRLNSTETLLPYTTLSRLEVGAGAEHRDLQLGGVDVDDGDVCRVVEATHRCVELAAVGEHGGDRGGPPQRQGAREDQPVVTEHQDRKSTRLNSSH